MSAMTGTTRLTRSREDGGSALIMTLMVMALLTALATTVSVLTIDNLQSSWRAQEAGSALNAADAGVAQALSYLRDEGVNKLNCSPTCSANPWGNQTGPATALLQGNGEAYRAWIEVVHSYPTSNPGRYRIHSTGTAAGAASRAVVVDVDVATTDLPTGVFARTINGGGDASIARESILSSGCVYNRSKIHMVAGEIDANYGIPIGVHSSQYITDSNGTGQYCPVTDNKLIHTVGQGGAQSGYPGCNPTFPYDQDRLGGDLTGSACASVQTGYPRFYGQRDLDGDGSLEVNGSYLKNDATLFSLFRIKTPALSQEQIDELRTVAQAQGNYHTSSTGWSSPNEDNAVMYFDLTNAPASDPRLVDLNNVSGFGRDPNMLDTSALCPKKSLAIVVEGGDVKLNSNQQLFASLYLTSPAPYGKVFKANGTSEFIGTIYADTVNLTGTANISLDKCFLANVSPALLHLQVVNYLEDDRGLG